MMVTTTEPCAGPPIAPPIASTAPTIVVFDEDDARSRKNYAPENLAVLRRLALNLLRTHPLQRSIHGKIQRAARRKDFLFELFAQMR